jgi:hypothetical protein
LKHFKEAGTGNSAGISSGPVNLGASIADTLIISLAPTCATNDESGSGDSERFLKPRTFWGTLPKCASDALQASQQKQSGFDLTRGLTLQYQLLSRLPSLPSTPQ